MTNERALEISRDIWSQASDLKVAAVECFAAYLAGFAKSATKRRERLEEQNRMLANQMRGVDFSNRSLRGEARKLHEKIAVKDKTILALQDHILESERRIQALRFWQGDKDKRIKDLKGMLQVEVEWRREAESKFGKDSKSKYQSKGDWTRLEVEKDEYGCLTISVT